MIIVGCLLWPNEQVYCQGKQLFHFIFVSLLNPIALRKSKIIYNFGLSECSRVNGDQLLKNMT